jgi:hypothetical protein
MNVDAQSETTVKSASSGPIAFNKRRAGLVRVCSISAVTKLLSTLLIQIDHGSGNASTRPRHFWRHLFRPLLRTIFDTVCETCYPNLAVRAVELRTATNWLFHSMIIQARARPPAEPTAVSHKCLKSSGRYVTTTVPFMLG